jgi:hypothetical protein
MVCREESATWHPDLHRYGDGCLALAILDAGPDASLLGRFLPDPDTNLASSLELQVSMACPRGAVSQQRRFLGLTQSRQAGGA